MNYFSSLQLCFLFTGILLIVTSLVFQNTKKNSYSLWFLVFGALCLFLFASLLDPFLNLWDERFHGLVAKNLMNHPLMPTLYDDPVVSMAYDRWDRATIWLHKQPLFLWQIALSFKLFGVSEFTLRLPSVLMSSFLVIVGYRTGKLLVNQQTGFYTGFLLATSFFLIEITSGRQMVDHNDVAFLFYTSASIWSWVEYIHSKKRYWILLIGLFAGFAILCKWLVGLLVYLGWGIYNMQAYRLQLVKYKEIFYSLLVTIIVVLPWQILIFIWYPAEANQALSYNTLHFTEVIEGHSGSVWFYVEHFRGLYGTIASYLVIPALVILFFSIKNRPMRIAYLALPVAVYLFFTIARTKMPGFPFIVAVPIFLSLATILKLAVSGMKKIPINGWLTGTLVVIFVSFIGYLNLQPKNIFDNHSMHVSANEYSQVQIHNKAVFQELADTLPENSVVFNVKGRHYIECMFYTGFPSYSFIPSQDQMNEVKNLGKKVVIIATNTGQLPDYLTSEKDVVIVNRLVKGWE